MEQLFPQWTNKAPIIVLVIVTVIIIAIVGMLWYYGSPRYTDVGYRPKQPIPYSHKLHAGDLAMDCRYCHHAVENSRHSNIPATQTCINCHKIILAESEKLLLLRESWGSTKAIQWIRVHKLPDYTYFNHSAHSHAGVGCISCHGNAAEMIEIMQVEPLNMGWCLDCHRNPAPHLRPPAQVTNMYWAKPKNQHELAAQLIKEKQLDPPVDCSGCHR